MNEVESSSMGFPLVTNDGILERFQEVIVERFQERNKVNKIANSRREEDEGFRLSTPTLSFNFFL